MELNLNGRVALITGSGRGIGKAAALALGREGARIVITDIDAAAVEQACAELRAQGCEAIGHAADVCSEEQVAALASRAIEAFGKVDILCANAGVFPQKKIVELTPEDWDQVLSTNLKSTFLCVKACIPAFEKAGKGRVVVTSSITGPITGYPGWSHYGASKAGQLGFLRTAAMELARYNTTINAVMPGNIITEGLQDLGQSYLDGMAKAIPLKRLGKVEDIGYAALFLASQEASYITGQTIVVDGGQILPESVEAIDSI